MKKLNVVGAVAILASAVGLALFRITGLTAHIVISVVALIIMLACMIAGKKSWKVPGVEILYRVFYLVALVTGFVLKAGSAAAAIVVVHKIAAAAFAVLFIVASVIALKSDK